MKGFNHGDIVKHKETGYLCLIRKDNNVMPLNFREDIGNGEGNSVTYSNSEAIANDFVIYPSIGIQNELRKYPLTKEESFSEHMERVFPFMREPNSEKGNLLIKLDAIQTLSDPVLAHRLANEMLLQYIGDKDITEAYNKIIKY